ncbi:MAG: hypothetical protein Kow0090_08860 [Myxococcota bacterium]
MKRSFLLGFIFAIGFIAFLAAKTQFTTGTRVTSQFLNSIYYTNGGHVHDGGANDGSAAKINCANHITWSGGCIPNATVHCADISFATCADYIPYNTIQFASPHYDFLPIGEMIATGDTNEYPVTGAVYRYAIYPANTTYNHFETTWRPPVGTTVSSPQARVLYTTVGADCGNSIYDLTLKYSDKAIGSALSFSTVINDVDMAAANDNYLRASNWANFAATNADNDAGAVVFRGWVEAAGQGEITNYVCNLNIIGIEIKFTGAKS